MKFLFLAIGGTAGTLLRYLLSGFVSNLTKGIFPYGTLVINLIGAFLIGIFWGMSARFEFSYEIKVFLFIGILGSFTTFSTYTLETINLFQDGEIKLAALNLIISNLGGLILVILGMMTARLLLYMSSA
ncbi:MAG: fluoride efflux transporter CrcB [Candidatus Cloacimonadota bacterium]|nr:MAG: fluoride efflux transporter CrcB [Candidatus Cloacimonadota bacterium]